MVQAWSSQPYLRYRSLYTQSGLFHLQPPLLTGAGVPLPDVPEPAHQHAPRELQGIHTDYVYILLLPLCMCTAGEPCVCVLL